MCVSVQTYNPVCYMPKKIASRKAGRPSFACWSLDTEAGGCMTKKVVI